MKYLQTLKLIRYNIIYTITYKRYPYNTISILWSLAVIITYLYYIIYNFKADQNRSVLSMTQ